MIMPAFCAPDQAESTLKHILAEGSGLHLPIVTLAPIIILENKSTSLTMIRRVTHIIAWNDFTEITVRLSG